MKSVNEMIDQVVDGTPPGEVVEAGAALKKKKMDKKKGGKKETSSIKKYLKGAAKSLSKYADLLYDNGNDKAGDLLSDLSSDCKTAMDKL